MHPGARRGVDATQRIGAKGAGPWWWVRSSDRRARRQSPTISSPRAGSWFRWSRRRRGRAAVGGRAACVGAHAPFGEVGVEVVHPVREWRHFGGDARGVLAVAALCWANTSIALPSARAWYTVQRSSTSRMSIISYLPKAHYTSMKHSRAVRRALPNALLAQIQRSRRLSASFGTAECSPPHCSRPWPRPPPR